MHMRSCAKYKAWKLELEELDEVAVDIESDADEIESDRDDLEPGRKRRRIADSSSVQYDHASLEDTFSAVDHMDYDLPAEFLEGSSKDGLPMENSDTVVRGSFAF